MDTPNPRVPISVWGKGILKHSDSRDSVRECEGPMLWESLSIRNVTEPTLIPVYPDPAAANGSAMIICPGGGFHFLMINKEGMEVAQWLLQMGITCFVLKYRLIPTPSDDQLFTEVAFSLDDRLEEIKRHTPLGIEDGRQAIRLLRGRASELGIRRDKIGIVGFSAGAAVAAGTALNEEAESRPDCLGVIYAAPREKAEVPANAPPLFIAYANDDDVVRSGAFDLFSWWKAAHARAEMHVYSRGGHGFGMAKQGLASDTWIDSFGRWLRTEEFVPPQA
jgi:acetyl esterase/lipase